MRTRRLGSHGPEISVVGFGTWEVGGMWGANPSDDDMVDAMRAGFDAGMSWVDTAELYGMGSSEELVGRAVRGRDDVLVFTKVAPSPPGSGYEPHQIRAACEASLRRLGRDAIDLYQLHSGRVSFDVDETWGTMGSLVDEGKVRWIGVSNFDVSQLQACEKVRHVDSLQPNFSMLFRRHDPEVEWCADNEAGVIAYGPLAFGLLTGAVTSETTFEASDWRSGSYDFGPLKALYETMFAPEPRARSLEIVERLAPVADRLGITRAQLAIAWCLARRGVTGAIVGTRNAGRARENAAAGDVVLDEETVREIDAIVRGA